MYIVQLEKGVYIAPWEGDPGRTVIKQHAKQFKTEKEGIQALIEAKKYRPFLQGMVISLEEHAKAL